jgi:enoyl-[acyl-carrier protein] reductase III
MTKTETDISNVLVTGGSRGIGREVAVRLAAAGANTVAIGYLENDAAAEETRGMIEAKGARCLPVRANLARPEEVDRMFAELGELETLDALVHCAAMGAFKPLEKLKINQWDLTLNVSTRSFLQCAQLAIPLMRGGGSMVAVSSLGSTRVVPNYGAMGPAKAALEAMVRYLAAELGPRNIRVNAVAGGLVRTDALAKMPNAAAMEAEVIARTPGGRIADPADIADVILFLLRPAARWICGQTVVADGGFSLY